MFKIGDKVMFKSLKEIKKIDLLFHDKLHYFHGIGDSFPLIHKRLKDKPLTIEAITNGDFLIKEDKIIPGGKTGFFYPQNWFRSYLKPKIDKLLKL